MRPGSSGPDGAPHAGGLDVPSRLLIRQAQEQSVLYRFTDRLFRARGLPDIYDVALDAVQDGLACSRAAILMFDPAGVARLVAWRGLSEGDRHAVEGHAPWPRGERNARPIFVDEGVRGDPLPPRRTRLPHERGRALAVIPIDGADGLVGTFMLYDDASRIFPGRERELALTIARQLGFAIERHIADGTARRLLALVESSEDAIIATDLDGVITDWNPGAERLFGYRRDTMIGRPVTALLPQGQPADEPAVLDRRPAGVRVQHYETVRRRQDGALVDISLTVSPIRDAGGRIIGASRIARDISERRRTEQHRQLLLREIDHRVKNLFAVAGGIVHLCSRTASTPAELAHAVGDRLVALARAHALTLSAAVADHAPSEAAGLHALLCEVLAPYRAGEGESQPIEIVGLDTSVPPALVTPLALLLNEFATNAVKHGSLSVPDGHVEIACSRRGGELAMVWREIGGPATAVPAREGFGSQLVTATASQIGHIERRWEPTGVVIELVIGADRLTG